MRNVDRRLALAAVFVFPLSLLSPAGALSTGAPAPPSVEFGELYERIEFWKSAPAGFSFEPVAKAYAVGVKEGHGRTPRLVLGGFIFAY